ncbi:MAG: DUF4394 domain-containing protein [Nevskiales bacterium]
MFTIARGGLRSLVVVLAVLSMNSCSNDDDDDVFQFGDLFAVTTSNRLISFNSDLPQQPRRILAISGLQAGENILGIDFRPSTGVLYGLSSNGRLYQLNTFNGAASLASTLAADPTDASSPFAGLSGTDFGVDFNPTELVALRIVGNSGQNLRVANPDAGNTFTDDNLNPGTPNVVAAAYTNSVPGASATTLYVIDAVGAAGDTLHIQNPPNNGTLIPVGALGVNTPGVTGFEIDGRNGRALAALNVGANSQLYSINLATGLATIIGTIGGGEIIRGLTLAPPEITVFGVTDTNTLVRFAPGTPQTVTTVGAISGLQAAENIHGLDFRPSNGLLYALGSSGRVYQLNTLTGAATLASVLSADIMDATTPFTTLSGTAFGLDFNPTGPVALRVVSDAEQNLRVVNPDAGNTFTDANLTPAGNVVAAAYTNNFAGATTTELFVIDSGDDMLKLQNPPNNGTLTPTGALGIAVENSPLNSFDIAGGQNGLALAALRVGGASNLYSINITTGAATQVGTMPIGGGTPLNIRGIAIRTQ